MTKDFRTIVWRIKQLGFNAVRLPFTFAHFGDAPVATNGSCVAATVVSYDFALQWLTSCTPLCNEHTWCDSNCKQTPHSGLLHAVPGCSRHACLLSMQAITRC